MIIKELKTVFLHRPKTAGTSIEYSFGYWGNTCPRRQARPEGLHFNLEKAKEYLENENENIDDYFVFIVQRNPYHRFFSTFWHWIYHQMSRAYAAASDGRDDIQFNNKRSRPPISMVAHLHKGNWTNLEDMKKNMLQAKERGELKLTINIEDFISYGEAIEAYLEHEEDFTFLDEYEFQHKSTGFIYNRSLLFPMDYWTCGENVHTLRFENIEEDFRFIQDKFGKENVGELIHAQNKGKSKSEQVVAEWYTPELSRLVEKIYPDEVAIYGKGNI